MDVCYYWKNFDKDVEAGRIGWFRSSNEKLAEFKAGGPDYLWVFKTPKGSKGQVQLLARLKWSDRAVVPAPLESDESYVFYDPCHSESVLFMDSGSERAVVAATDWIRRHFPEAIRGNFQGERGQHAIRGPMLQELHKFARTLTASALQNTVEA